MINFVIVSHSAKIAQGVSELARQIASPECLIIPAGGIDDAKNPIGTDAVKIMQAIEEAFSPDGVLIMVDLGSAILSAETALDLLEPSLAEHVKISPAPLVEGTLAAVISACSGDSMACVLEEANQAANLKLEMVS